jgi:two-component system, LytTR family, sensor kinase
MNRPPPPGTDHPRLGMGIVLASIVGLWLFYFLITSVRGSIVELGMEHELLWRRGVVCLAGIAVTIILWLCLRLVDRRGLSTKIVLALLLALPGSLAIAQVNQMIFAEMQEKVMIERGAKQGVRITRDEAGNILMEVPSPSDPDSPLGEGGALPAGQTPGQTIVLAEAPKP